MPVAELKRVLIESFEPGVHAVALRDVVNVTGQELQVNKDYNKLASDFNSGASKPHLSVHTLESRFIPALAASMIAAGVDEEKVTGKYGVFHAIQGHLLNSWKENRERELQGEQDISLSHRLFEGLEFIGAERLIEEGVHHALSKMREKLSFIPENALIDNAIAALVSSKIPHLLHSNAIQLERYVALNATAVDPDALLDELRKLPQIQTAPTPTRR